MRSTVSSHVAFDLRHTPEETKEEFVTEPLLPVAQYHAMNDVRETVRLPAAAIASLCAECAPESGL